MIMGMPQDYEADTWRRAPAPGETNERGSDPIESSIVGRVAVGGGARIDSTLENFAKLRKLLKASQGLHKGG